MEVRLSTNDRLLQVAPHDLNVFAASLICEPKQSRVQFTVVAVELAFQLFKQLISQVTHSRMHELYINYAVERVTLFTSQ